MFIATSARPTISLSRSETYAHQVKAVALLRSFGVKKGAFSYKHLAPLGRSDDVLLLFQLECPNEKWKISCV